MADISAAHVALLTVHASLTPFEVARFAGGQLPVSNALRDTLLLVIFTLMNALLGRLGETCASQRC